MQKNLFAIGEPPSSRFGIATSEEDLSLDEDTAIFRGRTVRRMEIEDAQMSLQTEPASATSVSARTGIVGQHIAGEAASTSETPPCVSFDVPAGQAGIPQARSLQAITEQAQQHKPEITDLPPHILSAVMTFLDDKDRVQASTLCRVFRIARHLVDVEKVKGWADVFDITNVQVCLDTFCDPSIFSTDGSVVEWLEMINTSIPDKFRSKFSISSLAYNPTWVKGLLQRAYTFNMIGAIGAWASVCTQADPESQLQQIAHWVATANPSFLAIPRANLLVLPKEISRLASLQFLHIGRNNFRKLPDSLFQLPEIKYILIEGNPELVVPQDTVAAFRARGCGFFLMP